MATINRFEDLKMWQEARVLCQQVFDLCLSGKMKNDFSFREQILRSSGSVMDNIAEGFERDGKKEFIQFLSYSKGSSGEVRSQLYRALDRNYIEEMEFNQLYQLSEKISKMIGSMMNYLKYSKYRGTKFKVEEPEAIYGAHFDPKPETQNLKL